MSAKAICVLVGVIGLAAKRQQDSLENSNARLGVYTPRVEPENTTIIKEDSVQSSWRTQSGNCAGSEFTDWTQEGPLIGRNGIRIHKAACPIPDGFMEKGKRNVPISSTSMTLTFYVKSGKCEKFCSPLWVTFSDADFPEYFYRWCFDMKGSEKKGVTPSKRTWIQCDEGEKVKDYEAGNDYTFDFAKKFKEKHGFLPVKLTAELGVVAAQGEQTTNIRDILWRYDQHGHGYN